MFHSSKQNTFHCNQPIVQSVFQSWLRYVAPPEQQSCPAAVDFFLEPVASFYLHKYDQQSSAINLSSKISESPQVLCFVSSCLWRRHPANARPSHWLRPAAQSWRRVSSTTVARERLSGVSFFPLHKLHLPLPFPPLSAYICCFASSQWLAYFLLSSLPSPAHPSGDGSQRLRLLKGCIFFLHLLSKIAVIYFRHATFIIDVPTLLLSVRVTVKALCDSPYCFYGARCCLLNLWPLELHSSLSVFFRFVPFYFYAHVPSDATWRSCLNTPALNVCSGTNKNVRGNTNLLTQRNWGT